MTRTSLARCAERVRGLLVGVFAQSKVGHRSTVLTVGHDVPQGLVLRGGGQLAGRKRRVLRRLRRDRLPGWRHLTRRRRPRLRDRGRGSCGGGSDGGGSAGRDRRRPRGRRERIGGARRCTDGNLAPTAHELAAAARRPSCRLALHLLSSGGDCGSGPLDGPVLRLALLVVLVAHVLPYARRLRVGEVEHAATLGARPARTSPGCAARLGPSLSNSTVWRPNWAAHIRKRIRRISSLPHTVTDQSLREERAAGIGDGPSALGGPGARRQARGRNERTTKPAEPVLQVPPLPARRACRPMPQTPNGNPTNASNPQWQCPRGPRPCRHGREPCRPPPRGTRRPRPRPDRAAAVQKPPHGHPHPPLDRPLPIDRLGAPQWRRAVRPAGPALRQAVAEPTRYAARPHAAARSTRMAALPSREAGRRARQLRSKPASSGWSTMSASVASRVV